MRPFDLPKPQTIARYATFPPAKPADLPPDERRQRRLAYFKDRTKAIRSGKWQQFTKLKEAA